MVGNDIVDLAEAQQTSRWQHPRFLDKLFTETEQIYSSKSKNPFLTIWRLWSIKEAAYKLYTQHYPSRFYKPKAFECSLSEENGTVIFQDFTCYVSTLITSDYVLSEARLNKTDCTSEVCVFKTKNINIQSKLLKHKLKKSASKAYQVKQENLRLTKDHFNIPRLICHNTKIAISLTHHGRFGAFALA